MATSIRIFFCFSASVIFLSGCATKRAVEEFEIQKKSVSTVSLPQLRGSTSLFRPSVLHAPITTAPLPATPQGTLSVYFLNVGQGDCTLLHFPNGKSILIDCGSTGGAFNGTHLRSVIRDVLGPQGQIDLLVITHPDADHYNQIPAVLGKPDDLNFEIGKVFLNGAASNYPKKGMQKWLNAMPHTKLQYIADDSFNVYPPKQIQGFDPAKIEVLAANTESTFSPPNTRSIVLKISFGEFSILLSGDATKDTDAAILERFENSPEALDVDVMKAAHHGSWATATHNTSWESKTKPETLIFSASADNSYGHPNVNLAKLFKENTVPAQPHKLLMWSAMNKPIDPKPFETESMYLTATNKDIVLKTNGKKYSIEFNS